MKSKEVRQCAHCGEPFNPQYGRPDNRFCSRSCYLGNRWGTTAERTCEVCGKPCVTTGKRSQKFCSFECRVKSQEGKPNPGRRNRATKPCDWCSEPVTRPASNFHSDRVFCNYDCMAAWQSANVTGEGHPRWKGGVPRSYGIGWKAARRRVLDRSGGICERCKSRPGAHVHHRLPARYFERIEDAHFIDNLIHVCKPCHAAEHRDLRRSLPLLDLIEAKR